MRRVGVHIAFVILVIVLHAGSALAQYNRETLRWINTNPKIKEIQVEGNLRFSSDEIREQLFSKTYSGFRDGFLKERREVILRRETIIRDTAQVKGMYLKEGYLNVRVFERFEQNPDSSARIVITVAEGPQYRIGPVQVGGEIPEELREHLYEPQKKLKRGAPLSLFLLRETQLKYKELFANHGYPFATIGYRIDSAADPSATPVFFELTSDSLVHFGAVTVEGAKAYGDHAARRELKVDSGKLYRREDIQESQRRLLRSGYYTNILLEVKDSATVGEGYDRLRPQFNLRVRERDVHYINARAGVAQDSLRDLALEFQAGFGKRNILKTRRAEFSANFIVSPKGDQRLLSHRYRLRFVEPWFVGIRMPLSLSGEYEPAVRSVLQPFRIQRWRIDAQTLFEVGRRLRIVSGVQYESVEILDIDPAEIDVIREEEGISVRRKLYLALRRDTRDDLFVPRRGAVGELKFDYYGDFMGGDANFFKVELSWSKYQPFLSGVTRASRVKFGIAEPLGKSDQVPIIDRYYIGGANGVRGFSTEELPPPLSEASGISPGAEFYVILNQELRFPLWGKLWSSLFFDAGNGWEGLDDPRISLSGMAYSYGAGLQYLSPAGPLRLDYARRIKTRGISTLPERNYRFHFTILYAF